MPTIRLLADDLTGALDTAGEFIPMTGALPVFWANGSCLNLPVSAAVDSGTRECDPAVAMARVGALVHVLEGADIAFKKIDSLLRGPTIAEIVACMRAGIWRHCALAPAFPFQGRVTRGSRQYAGMNAVSDELVAVLQSFGLAAQPGRADGVLQPGISVFDAETDLDLQRIVATVRHCAEPVLWVGTGGLAQALTEGHDHPAAPKLPRPVLGLFGSDQKVSADQLAACGPHWLQIEDHEFDVVPLRLGDTGLALISFRLPNGIPRTLAASRIASGIARLVDRIDPPGSVVVAGGETLRSLCDALGATSLEVQGRSMPGVPRSIMIGGRWNGVTVVSKSGAFGHSSLLRELILERTAP
jgi:uncharacterized protein YgbK (DUF1537 family)